MTPFWLKLLKAHNKKGGYGLTLPFIAGAYKQNDGRNEVQLNDIKTIIASMASETPEESYIIFKECDRLLQPVFAEAYRFYKPSDVYTKIYNTNNDVCSLFVAPVTFASPGASIDSFSNYLFELYKTELINNNFSYSNGGFTKFNDSDYDKILLAKTLEDDE